LLTISAGITGIAVKMIATNITISDVAAVLRCLDFLDGYQVALARN
jgi:hypothetical protein